MSEAERFEIEKKFIMKKDNIIKRLVEEMEEEEQHEKKPERTMSRAERIRAIVLDTYTRNFEKPSVSTNLHRPSYLSYFEFQKELDAK